jgi:thiol-disulfide isomerase/thioredoxin
MPSLRSIKNPFVLIPLCAGLVLPCAAFLLLRFSPPANSQAQPPLPESTIASQQPLPETDLFELNGTRVAPDLLRKGKVLLVFLTTECEACQKEIRLLSHLESRIAGKIKIYGVGMENQTQVMSFIKNNEVETRILLDKNGALMSSLGVKYFPTKLLLQDGIIVKSWFGNSPSEDVLLNHLGL